MSFTTVRRLSLPCILGFLLVACSAEFTEKNTPLHPPHAPAFEPSAVQFTIYSPIPMNVIEPSSVRRVIRKIIGWIPIAGDIAELPFDFAMALLPNFPSSDITRLPDGISMADPSTMDMIERVEITRVELFITPEKDRGNDYKRSRCYVFFKCRDQDLSFIKELQLLIVENKDEKDAAEGFLLARGVRHKNLSKDKKRLVLVPNRDLNLVGFIKRLPEFQVKTWASGKPPKYDLYLEGFIELKITLKL